MEKNSNISKYDFDREVAAFMTLPPELHLMIAYFLPFPFNIHLRLTCSYFHALISPLTHEELLVAERTEYAMINELYTCRYCLRLRSVTRFAERMLQRRRSKGAREAKKRFCVDCGLMQRGDAEEARYGPGAQIVVQGVSCVLCIVCRKFEIGAKDLDGRHISLCRKCYEQSAVTGIR
jgi:hypothetical protein